MNTDPTTRKLFVLLLASIALVATILALRQSQMMAEESRRLRLEAEASVKGT